MVKFGKDPYESPSELLIEIDDVAPSHEVNAGKNPEGEEASSSLSLSIVIDTLATLNNSGNTPNAFPYIIIEMLINTPVGIR